jgi:hypothetical protein
MQKLSIKHNDSTNNCERSQMISFVNNRASTTAGDYSVDNQIHIHSLYKKASRNTDGLQINRHRKSKSSYETTKTLIMVSTAFLILNSPMHLCKTYYFFKKKFSNTFQTFSTNSLTNSTKNTQLTDLYEIETNHLEEIIERITCFIYYINYALNFFLYSFNLYNFRENILAVFKKIFRK